MEQEQALMENSWSRHFLLQEAAERKHRGLPVHFEFQGLLYFPLWCRIGLNYCRQKEIQMQ